MKEANLTTEWRGENNIVKHSVPCLLYKEGDIYFAYIPPLDLTGYGNNEKEAEESLKVVLGEFLRYTLAKNTLTLELKRLGWKIRSKTKPYIAPQISDLINRNEDLKEIVNTKQFSTSKFNLYLPALA